MRRQPERNAGYRPPRAARFAGAQCRACGAGFLLDRAAQPWARARTCSPSCAKREANRGRTPSTCRHCEMVEAWRLVADTAQRAREVPAGDEDRTAPTFAEWLRVWRYEAWDVDPAA